MKVFPRVLVFLMFFPVMPQLAAAPRIVTAAQVNGTWRTPTNEFKVLALGKQKLRVEFDGTYEYRVNGEWMANTGTGAGIAVIAGDTATFRPEGVEMDCAITMRFTAGALLVTQEGGCGFGHHVTASGTYRKVSDRRPTFSGD
ncbi:MAG: hypothetical protein RKR03_02440 [Candidatus Competibacter sp.]|nr:hypothetical protein [Candidatus Competibacter sp.]MDS4059414.1 hypothetical protein [Candidatus Contendobacter sp.]